MKKSDRKLSLKKEKVALLNVIGAANCTGATSETCFLCIPETV